MNRLARIAVAVAAATVMWCCSDRHTPAQTVADARAEYENMNYDRCQTICDNLVADSANFVKLDVRQLCNLAELYILLDVVANGDKPATVADINDANAARCLGRARELNADSVDAFINELSAESAARLSVLNRVSAYLTIPRDSLVVADEAHSDSL